MRSLIFGLVILQLPAIVHAEPPVFFDKVDVFDGERLIEDTGVLIVDGTIREIGNVIQPTPDTKIIAGEGRTLLPGLIDCHTHVVDETTCHKRCCLG